VHILDCVATDKARMPAGVLLIPRSGVSVVGAGRRRGCGQTNADRFCVLLTGVALGEVMAASVGEVMAASEEMGVELESSSLTCWSTMARARSIVGVTGASCSLPLPRLLLLCSDIVMLSERG
jgi:hypothetical protein